MPLAGRSGCHEILPAVATIAVAIAGLGQTACYSVPAGKSAVSSVAIEGTHDIDDDELEERLATRESPKFLGLFSGVVYEYETFDRYAVRRDLNRIERYLQARGYYEAHVYAARVVTDGDKVKVTIEVEQGPAVTVDSVGISPKEPLDRGTEDRVRSAIAAQLPVGGVFDEDKLEEAEKAATRALTGNGYAAAKVTRKAEVDLATHQVRLYFTIEPGPLAKFGEVKFTGLAGLPESDVRRVFGIKEGELYSSEAVDDGRQSLLDLGVFSVVEIDQNTDRVAETQRVPVVVKTEPAKLRAILAGGGVELDSRKADIHLQLGWQNSNFLGGLRKFDLRFKPGIVFYPTRFPELQAPEKILYEQKVTATLRQPALFEKRTTGLVRAEYSSYPVLFPDPTPNVIGYHEIRSEIGVERTFMKRLLVAPEYGFQANFPFDYIGKTEGVEHVLVSYVELGTSLDYRDNPVKPRKGFYLSNQFQFAGGPLLGDATDIKFQPDARAFIALPKKVTLALRASVGFLYPINYGQYADANFANPGPSRIEQAQRDYQLYFFRGFFGGGPSSNRGYPLRGVSPHDFIPYLSPVGQSAVASGCDPNDPEKRGCRLPTGGPSLWEVNAELRFLIGGPVSAAVFCDAGDVSPFVFDIRLTHPHLSCGAGGRYDTPVGPIRLDVGYRIPGLQFPSSDKFELAPDTLFGAPIAIAFGIGEAF